LKTRRDTEIKELAQVVKIRDRFSNSTACVG